MIYFDAHSNYLNDHSRNYIKHLMSSITYFQDWGISAGVKRYFLKNGWRKVSDNQKWKVHSIGNLPDQRSYNIAIYTRNNRNFNNAVHYVEDLAKATRKILKPENNKSQKIISFHAGL